jgi:probable HAF family extracellular repeat protein
MKPWLLIPAFGLSCAFAAATAQTYTITGLPVMPNFPFAGTFPAAINDSGEVTGAAVSLFASAPGVPVGEAFLYSEGKMTALSGEYSYANAITGDTREGPWHGDEERRKLRVVGQASFTAQNGPGPRRAFLYEDHFLRDLGVLPGGTFSLATAVNSFGEIAGTADTTEGVEVAVVFRHGNIVSLGTLPGSIGSEATGINNWGDVTGVIHMANFDDRAFLYHNGKMISLGTLPGSQISTAAAINDSMEITGTATSSIGGNYFQHAFLWSHGKMIDLGLLPNGVSSEANAINESGDVVGQANITTSTGIYSVPFLYSNGKMHDLNDFLPPNSGWTITSATGINNRGQIVGDGLLTAGGGSGGVIMNPDCRDRKNRDCNFCRDQR